MHTAIVKNFKKYHLLHIVIIFDECHRSQFGDMHTAIVKNFKKYHLFGFTGTPIFSVNSGRAKNPEFFTTGQTFGDQLHSYTIVDAINDKNVLPFRVDYIKTMAEPRIQNSLLQVRPLEISSTVIRLWMPLTIKMFFHSGLIILKRWMWRSDLWRSAPQLYDCGCH